MAEFNPSPDDKITIGTDTFRVSPHPSVPSFAFGQEGRKAFVFQLAHSKRRKLYALKKFKQVFRYPDLKDICQSLAQFAHLPGMGVCERKCLTGPDYKGLLREYPDLEYAVLMPWMNGSTWYDLVVGQVALDPESSLTMAWTTSLVLAGLEEAGMAHCDVAAPNVIIDMAAGEVHLVDVEDMYAPGMTRPQAMPAGTDGYNHITADVGLWSPTADRFAGAVLLAEMLGWHNPAVRDHSDEEHYFALDAMQQDGDAYRLLAGTLYDTSPRLADLLERAWFSPTLDACPPLAEWANVLDPLARPSPVTEWVPLTAMPVPAAPHPGTWEAEPASEPPPAAGPVTVPRQQDGPPPPPAQPPDPHGPLVGFRPIELPQAPVEAASRPIELPAAAEPVQEEASSVEVALPEPEPGASAPEPQLGEPPPLEDAAIDEAADEPDLSPFARIKRRFQSLGKPPAALVAQLPAPSPDRADLPPGDGDDADAPLMIVPPPAPHLTITSPDERGSFVLNWVAVPEATYYVLQESSRMGFSDGKQASVPNATQWHVNEREPGTYYYRVRAHTGDDFGEWSNIVFAKIEPRVAQGDIAEIPQVENDSAS